MLADAHGAAADQSVTNKSQRIDRVGRPWRSPHSNCAFDAEAPRVPLTEGLRGESNPEVETSYHWWIVSKTTWSRQDSNLLPLAYEASALPMSYWSSHGCRQNPSSRNARHKSVEGCPSRRRTTSVRREVREGKRGSLTFHSKCGRQESNLQSPTWHAGAFPLGHYHRGRRSWSDGVME